MSDTVLIVVTSTPELPDGRESGFDWVSLAVPYWRLREAGCRIGFASPAGGKPPGDPATAEDAEGERPGAVDMFLGDADAVAALSRSVALDAVDADAWQAVLIADGLSGLWDLGASEALETVLSQVWSRGGIVAAIGTGTLPLARLRDAEGRIVVAGRAIAAPSDSALAERLEVAAPALPETALRAVGAHVVLPDAEDDRQDAVEDGRIVTASDGRMGADLALELLGALAIHGAARPRDDRPDGDPRSGADDAEAEEDEGP
jgi:putative intracellular protease/amidase